MKKVLLYLLIFSISLNAYTVEDHVIKTKCEERIYGQHSNGYNYEACMEMLQHKDAMKKYGASSSYWYWTKRLGKKY